MPRIVFFGTGSAAPSKLRNSSAIHLSVPGFGGVLLDAGEGTIGQMNHGEYGTTGAAEEIRWLRLIWISHHHIDHQLGLFAYSRSVLAAVRQITKARDNEPIVHCWTCIC